MGKILIVDKIAENNVLQTEGNYFKSSLFTKLNSVVAQHYNNSEKIRDSSKHGCCVGFFFLKDYIIFLFILYEVVNEKHYLLSASLVTEIWMLRF